VAEERTPSIAPGPFYVVKDQCISCGAPEMEAPMLMARDDVNCSCYFRRQPETPDEEYRALRAVWASCCGAVRYGGDDPVILQPALMMSFARSKASATSGGSRATSGMGIAARLARLLSSGLLGASRRAVIESRHAPPTTTVRASS
jgi:hypothetical protein